MNNCQRVTVGADLVLYWVHGQQAPPPRKLMTKTQAISALIINRIAQGQSAQEAFDAVIGAGAYERLAVEIAEAVASNWDAFQSDAKSCKA